MKEHFTEEQRRLVERVAHRIVRLQLSTAALFFLESLRPLNFIGSQLMHFLSPVVQAFGDFQDYDRMAALLEDRRSIDYMIETIEKAEEKAGATSKS